MKTEKKYHLVIKIKAINENAVKYHQYNIYPKVNTFDEVLNRVNIENKQTRKLISFQVLTAQNMGSFKIPFIFHGEFIKTNTGFKRKMSIQRYKLLKNLYLDK